MHSRWPRLDGLAYGGDYNPEQWPAEVWERGRGADARGGGHAGLRRHLLLGHARTAAGRVRVRLAGQGARPAARRRASRSTWAPRPPRRRPGSCDRHPEARPVTRDGLRLGGGSRQTYCPSSPAYASAAAGITRQLAERYGSHPAVVLWHVNNEYGAPLGECYCETSAAAFRDWLRERYGDLDTLNEHWGAAFWSQRYAAVGRDRRAADVHDRGEPRAAAGLRPVQLRRAARLLPPRAGHPARAVARHPGHHQLHGQQLQERGLLAVGAGGRRDLQRQLPDRRAPPTPTWTWRCPPT